MPGKREKPRVITDHQREPVCILPTRCYFNDERRKKRWQRYAKQGESLNHQDLLALFPDAPVPQQRTLQRQETD